MFDDCKEDLLPQSFPCDCGGEISEYGEDVWSCDSCDFEKKNLSVLKTALRKAEERGHNQPKGYDKL